jgi:hypothetical protein
MSSVLEIDRKMPGALLSFAGTEIDVLFTTVLIVPISAADNREIAGAVALSTDVLRVKLVAVFVVFIKLTSTGISTSKPDTSLAVITFDFGIVTSCAWVSLHGCRKQDNKKEGSFSHNTGCLRLIKYDIKK